MTELEGSAGEPRRSWSRSTERAATILSYFSFEEPRLKVATLAERLGTHPSTVYRYVEALEGAHLIERDEQPGTYKLGIRLLELSTIVLHDLAVRRHALEEMDALRDKLGLLVNLGLLRGADVVHVAHSFPIGWPRKDGPSSERCRTEHRPREGPARQPRMGRRPGQGHRIRMAALYPELHL